MTALRLPIVALVLLATSSAHARSRRDVVYVVDPRNGRVREAAEQPPPTDPRIVSPGQAGKGLPLTFRLADGLLVERTGALIRQKAAVDVWQVALHGRVLAIAEVGGQQRVFPIGQAPSEVALTEGDWILKTTEAIYRLTSSGKVVWSETEQGFAPAWPVGDRLYTAISSEEPRSAANAFVIERDLRTGKLLHRRPVAKTDEFFDNVDARVTAANPTEVWLTVTWIVLD